MRNCILNKHHNLLLCKHLDRFEWRASRLVTWSSLCSSKHTSLKSSKIHSIISALNARIIKVHMLSYGLALTSVVSAHLKYVNPKVEINTATLRIFLESSGMTISCFPWPMVATSLYLTSNRSTEWKKSHWKKTIVHPSWSGIESSSSLKWIESHWTSRNLLKI